MELVHRMEMYDIIHLEWFIWSDWCNFNLMPAVWHCTKWNARCINGMCLRFSICYSLTYLYLVKLHKYVIPNISVLNIQWNIIYFMRSSRIQSIIYIFSAEFLNMHCVEKLQLMVSFLRNENTFNTLLFFIFRGIRLRSTYDYY